MHSQDEMAKFIKSFCLDTKFRDEIISNPDLIVFDYQKQLAEQYLERKNQLISKNEKNYIHIDALDFLKSRW